MRRSSLPYSTSTAIYAKKKPSGGAAGARIASAQKEMEGTSKQKQKQKQSNNNKNNKRKQQTGGLRRLPVVKSPTELINKARKVAFKTVGDKKVKNARNRARKEGAETMDAITKALCVPLRDVVNG